MTTYMTLMRMTADGRKNIADSLKRGDAIRERLAKVGVELLDYFITLGEYDCVMLFEAPDEAAMAHALLEIGTFGAVETRTMTVVKKDDYARSLEAIAARDKK